MYVRKLSGSSTDDGSDALQVDKTNVRLMLTYRYTSLFQ